MLLLVFFLNIYRNDETEKAQEIIANWEIPSCNNDLGSIYEFDSLTQPEKNNYKMC